MRIRYHKWRITLRLILVSLLTSIALSHSKNKPTEYETLLGEFLMMKGNETNVVHLANRSLQRDVGTFRFQEGDWYFCTPVNGRVCAAYFAGKGTFSFNPPARTEKEQLHRYFDKDSLSEEFSYLFLVFTDSTEAEIKRYGSISKRSVGGSIDGGIESCLKFCTNRERSTFDEEVMSSLLNHQTNDLFYAQIGIGGMKPLFFEINPFSEEEILLGRRDEHIIIWHNRELVSSFKPKPSERASDQDQTDYYKGIRTERYVINSSIAKQAWSSDLSFSATSTVTFHSLISGQRWIWYILEEDLRVDSLIWQNGEHAVYYQGKKSGEVWIECSQPLNVGDERTLTFYYHGDYIVRGKADQFLMKGSIDWYPQHDYSNRALFDMTFHTPPDLTLVCVGDLVSSEKTNDFTTSHWLSRYPFRSASFTIGFFKELKIERDSMPLVTILMTDNMIHGRGSTFKDVGIDVANSISFFGKFFGKCPVESFYASEVPGTHGEAFPGLIHLSEYTFSTPRASGEDEIFRAHEVAHQWWGVDLQPKTYHDKWLSEGFADYSGLLYLQALTHDNDKVFDILRDWKKTILSNRKYLFGSGQQAGPISLGYRTESDETRGDYSLIIYKKGAWVLHMLRNMTLDLVTMKEDVFRSILQDFYSSFRGTMATNGDFQSIVEKHMGMKMAWFFKEWLDETQIPLYKFAYTVEQMPDGKFKARCRIKQLNVPSDFMMYVPIEMDFGGGRKAFVRKLVRGVESEFSLPLMPSEPKAITLNSMESVLCEVETERW